MSERDPRAVSFVYRDFRAVVTMRHVLPHGIRWDATEHAPEPQWLLDGYDLDERATRTFALAGVLGWRPASPPPVDVPQTDAKM